MKTFICASLFGVLSILCASVSAAQEIVGGRVVEGTVVSDMGSVISNAKVSVKGSNTTTLSGADGHYSIVVNSEEDVLVFERDGYTAAELQVGQNKVVDATMTIEDLFAIDLEDLMNTSISSSSFFTLSAKETPGYIYSRDMREVHGQRSLIEIANMSMPGVSEGAHPDTRIIGVRGMKTVDNSKTMVMFDGQNLNLRANVGYGVGLSSKLLGDVKTLEVSLGPNAIVHGSGAISGYINMVPKNGYNDKGFYATVEKEYEENAQNMMSGISRAEVGYGFGNEKRNAYIYAGYYFSNGWQADSDTILVKDKNTAVNSTNGATKRANMRFSAHTNFDGFGLNLGYMQNYLGGNSSKGVEQNVFQRQFNASIKYNKDITDYENVEVRFNNELSDLGRIQSELAGGAESHIEGKIIAKTTRFANNSLAVGALLGARKFYTGKFYFGNDIDPVSVSDKAFMRDPMTDDVYVDENGNKNNPKYLWACGQMPKGSWNEFAIFAEDIYKLNDQLVVALGLRYDRFSVKDFDDVQSNFAPRLALSYLVNDNHVVKASYQQGFRTMDFYNLGQTIYQKVANVSASIRKYNKDYKTYYFDVTPEKLHSIELNYMGEYLDKALKLEANAYFNTYENTIDFYNLASWESDKYLADSTYRGDYTAVGEKYFTGSDREYFMMGSVGSNYNKKGKSKSFGAYVNNSENVKIIGGELIATLNASTNTLVRASYSLSKSLTDSYGDNIQHPSQMLKLDATQYFFSRKLMLNAQFEFEPALEDNEKNHENYHDVYFESRTMLDGAVAYRLTNAVTIQASVNNILGEDRPGITYKPDMNNNYTELTNIGCNERRYWLSVLFAL
ncbi:MAG: TonB-dependent receptor [Marinilabiliaceae bacterium]|nr:TonB-dependent receptor [Marinilabiliaceae bacterium]